MDFFIASAWAQAPAGQPDPLTSFLLDVGISIFDSVP